MVKVTEWDDDEDEFFERIKKVGSKVLSDEERERRGKWNKSRAKRKIGKGQRQIMRGE